MRFLTLLIAMLMASPTFADSCPNGRCLVPRWQAATPSLPNPSPHLPTVQLRTATCRILHETGRGRSWGSGTLVRTDDARCVVLTCAHLFRDGVGRTRIWFPGGNRLDANLAGIDQQHDLAALAINIESDERAVDLATSSPQPGEVVFGCGYGQTGSFRCQGGTVIGFGYSHHGTAPSRRVPSNALPTGTASSETLMFAGAARQGDSGGGVFNGAGRLVAVVWETDESRTMATTTCHVRQFLKSLALRTQGRRKRPLSKHAPPSPASPSPASPPQRPTLKPETTTNKLFGLADRLDSLRQRVEASEQTNLAASKQSTKRLGPAHTPLPYLGGNWRKLPSQRRQKALNQKK